MLKFLSTNWALVGGRGRIRWEITFACDVVITDMFLLYVELFLPYLELFLPYVELFLPYVKLFVLNVELLLL